MLSITALKIAIPRRLAAQRLVGARDRAVPDDGRTAHRMWSKRHHTATHCRTGGRDYYV